MFVFNKTPTKERWYWPIGAISATLAIIILGNSLGSGDVGRPNLRADIEEVTIGTIAAGTPVAWVIAYISNSGAPSAVGPYDFSVRLPRGDRLLQGGRMTIPDFTTITYGNQGIEYVYGADSLTEKTLRPIQRGERVYGRLLFTFPGVPLSDLESLVTQFELQFVDVWNRHYSATYSPHGTNANPLEFPGMRPRFTKPAESTGPSSVTQSTQPSSSAKSPPAK
jgi:hypothetical protein